MIYFSGSKKVTLQKHGITNFAFIVLETLPKTLVKQTNKDLL